MELDIDGRSAFVHTGGVDLDASRGLVLLVHGAGNDHTIWRFVTRRLAAAGFPVAAPDFPGHGKSAGPALGSVGAMAQWCLEVATRLTSGPVTVIGHSMGSLVAMEMALQSPDRVRAVALLAASDGLMVHPDLQAAAEREDRLAADLIVGWTHTGRSRFGHHDSPGVWMAGSNRRLLEQNAGSLAADLAACSDWDGAARFAAAGIPALVVYGERDRMAPGRAAVSLAGSLRQVEVVKVPGGSHASVYDHPSEVVDPLLAWLRSLHTSE
jgi:pimeloyl-ACP methyl ester carboxylesterase